MLRRAFGSIWRKATGRSRGSLGICADVVRLSRCLSGRAKLSPSLCLFRVRRPNKVFMDIALALHSYVS
jgi:hypothetical protein